MLKACLNCLIFLSPARMNLHSSISHLQAIWENNVYDTYCFINSSNHVFYIISKRFFRWFILKLQKLNKNFHANSDIKPSKYDLTSIYYQSLYMKNNSRMMMMIGTVTFKEQTSMVLVIWNCVPRNTYFDTKWWENSWSCTNPLLELTRLIRFKKNSFRNSRFYFRPTKYL